MRNFRQSLIAGALIAGARRNSPSERVRRRTLAFGLFFVLIAASATTACREPGVAFPRELSRICKGQRGSDLHAAQVLHE